MKSPPEWLNKIDLLAGISTNGIINHNRIQQLSPFTRSSQDIKTRPTSHLDQSVKQMAENETNLSGNLMGNNPNSANVKQSAEMPLCNTVPDSRTPAQGIISLTDTQANAQTPSTIPAQKRRKPARHYEQFGETIRYLTWDEWQKLLDSIDDYRHKLMIRLIYHLGCRVGEFVRIQLKHIDLNRNSVFFPAENTKTGHRRTSHAPVGLMNEIKSILKRDGRMLKRSDAVLNPEKSLFRRSMKSARAYSENRIRQIFQRYVKKAGLDREYGNDSKGRKLHLITVHSLRHSHIMHHIHIHKLPLSIVQKQVGHRTLKATSVYLNPSEEAVANAYNAITRDDHPSV